MSQSQAYFGLSQLQHHRQAQHHLTAVKLAHELRRLGKHIGLVHQNDKSQDFCFNRIQAQQLLPCLYVLLQYLRHAMLVDFVPLYGFLPFQKVFFHVRACRYWLVRIGITEPLRGLQQIGHRFIIEAMFTDEIGLPSQRQHHLPYPCPQQVCCFGVDLILLQDRWGLDCAHCFIHCINQKS